MIASLKQDLFFKIIKQNKVLKMKVLVAEGSDEKVEEVT